MTPDWYWVPRESDAPLTYHPHYSGRYDVRHGQVVRRPIGDLRRILGRDTGKRNRRPPSVRDAIDYRDDTIEAHNDDYNISG